MTICLVTGGAGFIGSHLVETLQAQGHFVRVLDNLASGKLANLSRVIHAVELYPGDLADLQLVRQVSRGVEVVFHLAALEEPFDTQAHVGGAIHADVATTRNVLQAACEAGVRRLIYTSSLRVYGATSGGICTEGKALQPLKPLGPEGTAKALGERACIEFARDHGLEIVRLRCTHVFGPRQPRNSPYAAVVRQALEAMLAGRSPVLEGDGRIAQDLISVGDVVHAHLIAAAAPRVAGKAYNIGRGRPTSARAIVEKLNAILGTRIEPTCGERRPLTDLDNQVDPSRAEVELGFCAGTDLDRGLRSCVEAFSTWPGRPHLGRFKLAPKQVIENGLP
jgi:UDP-glucose 4-epimerase